VSLCNKLGIAHLELFQILRFWASHICNLEAQKKALKEQAAQEIAAVRKALAEKTAALKANERRLRANSVRDQKKRDNHAKILLGVAAIHLHQSSEVFRKSFEARLSEFYSDSPLKLEAAKNGLGIAVKKPASDSEQV
jgi:hypothetical protein